MTKTPPTDRRSAPTESGCPTGLVAARRGGSAPDRYVVPTTQQREQMTNLVASLSASNASIGSELATSTSSLGFDAEPVPDMPGVVLLRELETMRRGGGAYLFRLGSSSRLVVQAPHTFYDEGTLQLSCDLFRWANARALFIDTAHRYKSAEMDEAGDHPADLAHSPESLFQAATEGLLSAASGVAVVQLHGFALRASGATVVLSSGVAKLDVRIVAQAKRALSDIVGNGVLRFPEETQELGAVTNVQGRAVRAVGADFLHVEMSAALRKELLINVPLRVRFLNALVESIETR